ncbi:hypothetical protein X946_3976 [Burkholderia sp. ABCPW 111]|nr:hypothetical protein X946_3976 [Burkholderia sp. ABCPW 111]
MSRHLRMGSSALADADSGHDVASRVKATPMQAISEQQARAIRGGGSAYANSAAYTVSLANQSIGPVVNGLLTQYQAQAVNQFKMALGSGS